MQQNHVHVFKTLDYMNIECVGKPQVPTVHPWQHLTYIVPGGRGVWIGRGVWV